MARSSTMSPRRTVFRAVARLTRFRLCAPSMVAAFALLAELGMCPAIAQTPAIPQSPAALQPGPGDICVVCEEPVALYRCRAEGANPAAAPPAGLQIICVTEIAQRGRHGRCRVDRTRGAAPCDGIVVAVSPPPPPLTTGGVTPSAPAPQAPIAPVQPPADRPPETMEALAKAAARQSTDTVKETTTAAGRQIEKAGSAVGSAFKKSWECVSSLFSRC